MPSFPVPTSLPTLLIVLRPTTKPKEREEPISPGSFGTLKEGASFLKKADYLFIDVNCTFLHDCDTNKETINNTLKYLKTSQNAV